MIGLLQASPNVAGSRRCALSYGVERDVETKAQSLERALSSDEKRRLRQFAEDISTLWHASTTRVQDKKRLIRCLLAQVAVRVPEGQAPLEAQVHWVGGEVLLVCDFGILLQTESNV
jgi:hypothetical protein